MVTKTDERKPGPSAAPNAAPVANQPASQLAPKKAKESKEARFRRLVVPRVGKALVAIRRVSNLANRAQYAYSDEQTAKIVAALKLAVRDVEEAFSRSDGKVTFTL